MFGILTTYTEWVICWLDSKSNSLLCGNHAQSTTSTSISTSTSSTATSSASHISISTPPTSSNTQDIPAFYTPQRGTLHLQSPFGKMPPIEDEVEDDEELDILKSEEACPRQFFGTRRYAFNGMHSLLPLFALTPI